MAKITLNDIANITGSETAALAALNENNSLIEAAIENTLSRDGTSPNAMNNDFDMNGYDIINAGNIDMESGTVGGIDITELVGIEGPQGPQGVPGNDGTNGTNGVSFIWRGTYSGATAYATNDAVSDQSSSWIALQATTGNAPPTLPTTSNAFWQLMAAKGTDGAGTGTVTSVSVVSANGLAGSVATATTTPAITLSTTITGVLKGNGTAISAASAGTDYYNPGGTDVAVADGGTGSSTAAGAATNLGLGTGDSPQFTAVNIGNATDTTVSRDSAGVIAVEGIPIYPSLPQNSKSAAYTTVLADAQKHILHPTADNNARTFTIDSNANVAYPIGTCITFVNQINTVTIAITSDTLTLAGAGTTGSRTLAANGIATALKIASTSWIISGVGLT